MIDAPRRLVTALALVGLPIAGSWLAAPSAQAAFHDGACTDDTGVTVVVDHQELGGGVLVRCAMDFPSGGTGLQALKLAGFIPEGTIKDGPAFVCRINNRPAADETLTVGGQEYRENCISTPPNGAFWSYWHAPAGGEWTFSQLGGSRSVEPGGYEGWSFSLNRGEGANPRPGVAPAARPEPEPSTPEPAPAPTSSAATRPASTTRPAPTQTTGVPSAPATTRRAEPTHKPTATPTTTATRVDSPTPTAQRTTAASPSPSDLPSPAATAATSGVAAAPATSASPTATRSVEMATAAPVEADPPPEGPGVGTYLGIGAVAVLSAAGGVVWWRRRSVL